MALAAFVMAYIVAGHMPKLEVEVHGLKLGLLNCH